MILPDVNVLGYALRTEGPHHALCRSWLERVVDGDSSFALSRLVLSSVVRVTTNRRIFTDPESLGEAFDYCNWLLAHPNAVVVEPGRRHWSIFERLCRDTSLAGPRVTEAWLAALAVEQGCEWITLDRDFARFEGLKWSLPTP